MDDFSSLNMHDSDILSVKLVNDPEGDDKLEVELDYVVEYSNPPIMNRQCLVFKKCRRVVLDFNLGLIAPESILDAQVLPSSSLLDAQRDVHRKLGSEMPSLLQHFSIELNSSGSSIDVLAEEWVLHSSECPPQGIVSA